MSFTVKLFVTLVLLGAVIGWAGPQDLIAAFSSVQPLWLALMACFVLLFLIVGAIGVCVLTTALLPSSSLQLILKSYLQSFAVGMFAPSKFGDLSYSYYLSHGAGSYGPGLAVVVVDKLVTAIICSIAAAMAAATYVGVIQALTILFAVALTVVTAGHIIGSQHVKQLISRYVLRSRQEYFTGFSTNVISLVTAHRKHLAANVALTAVRVVVLGAAIQAGYRSFGVHLDLFPAITVISSVQLVGWIPLTISGLGLTHGAAAVFFTTCCEIDRRVTVDLLLVNSGLTYLLSTLIILIYGLKE